MIKHFMENQMNCIYIFAIFIFTAEVNPETEEEKSDLTLSDPTMGCNTTSTTTPEVTTTETTVEAEEPLSVKVTEDSSAPSSKKGSKEEVATPEGSEEDKMDTGEIQYHLLLIT